jgi:hypothetical protein
MRDFALLCIGVAVLVASFRKLNVKIEVVESPQSVKISTVHVPPIETKPQWGVCKPEYDSFGKLTRWHLS